MTATRVKLTAGSRYRVIYPRAHLENILPVPGQRGAYQPEIKKLAVGDVIEYVEQKWGWGSDPGLEEVFKTSDGYKGSLHPGGIWGGVSDKVLEPATPS